MIITHVNIVGKFLQKMLEKLTCILSMTIAKPMEKTKPEKLELKDGSSIAVIGGGPAGSFFTYFALDLANRMGLEIEIDIIEPKDFTCAGPKGCNNCGGIVSESLVQALSTEGIVLPPNVIRRGIESSLQHLVHQ